MTVSGTSMIRGAVFITIVSIFLLIYFVPDKNAQSALQSSGTTYGRILVDSPEVYTRERMVNDRFRQEAWLLEQLDKLSDEAPGVQGFVEAHKTSERTLDLSVANAATPADGESTELASNADSSVAANMQPGQAQLTPIESFRGRQSVREEVRNALIENQLDDRHDLNGNTLYRLKFDATVIPGNDTSAWAQINVRFKRKLSNDVDEEQALKALYDRWMGDLREQVNTTYNEEMAKEVSDKDAKPRLYAAILNRYSLYVGYEATKSEWGKMPYMADPQCEKSLLKNTLSPSEVEGEDFLVLQSYSIKGFDCLMKSAPEIMGCEEKVCLRELAREDVMNKVLDIYGTTLGQREGVRKELTKSSRNTLNSYVSTQLPSALQKQNSQQYVSFSPALDLNSILVDEFSPKIYAVPLELNDSERKRFNDSQSDIKFSAVPIELSENEQDIYRRYRGDDNIPEDWDKELFSCENIVVISVSGREYKICRESLSQLQQLSNQDDNSGTATSSIDGEMAYHIDGSFPYITISGSGANDRKILETWTAVLNCPKTASIKVAQREFTICDSWFKDLQKLSIAIDTGQELPSIVARIDNDYDGLPIISANIGYAKFREKLRESEKNKFLFSYAVTPRESSQQMASSSRQAMAEQMRASASGGGDGAAVEAGARRSSLFSEYAQIMQRRPIIVGVASHPSDVHSDQKDEKSAELGWLIGPKLTVGKDGLTTYRHLPSQNSLSALVSAPSWWRRADIEVETGWLTEDGEFKDESTKFSYQIALPGDQDEITSALLLGGRRPKPSIESVEPLFVKLGEKAKLLIEGQNLWRSTVVTIGAQRSKKIFVLPNMKGIIAEFDPINSQEVAQGEENSTIKVRVWTSEGVADSPKSLVVTK